MLNGIVDSWKVRAQKAASSSQSTVGSSFIPHRSEEQQEIEMLEETVRQQDEQMRQWDDFYAHAFTQQQIIIQFS
jgi:hypothetical protein